MQSYPLWVQKILSYFIANRQRLFPFLVVGGAAFVVNWGLFKLLRVGGMTSRGEVFFAFLLSMEISVLFNFMLQYLWTWKDTARLRGWSFLRKLAAFHGAVGVGAGLRALLFPLGQISGLQDDLNFIVGVAAATVLDFVLYDKMVFKGAHR
jgi:putative flippase GtrA